MKHLLVATVLVSCMNLASPFVVSKAYVPTVNVPQRKGSPLHMSSVQKDPEEKTKDHSRKISSWLTSKLPPPPEDQLSMIGDVSVLFFYSFLDHYVNSLYDRWLNSPGTIALQSAPAAIESSSAASAELLTSAVSNSLPVWFDTVHSAPYGSIPLNAALPLEHHIIYAPAISSAGAAACLITSAWLVSGYFTGVFRFQNTLECSPTKAIIATAKTWVFSTLIMLGIAYWSDSFVGCVDCLHKSVGLTKADTDYIFDSLNVLLMWRFILSSLLGYGDDD
eukprot:CAMPEP_0197235888 /NCGR_PEP_ID=MMETSP1429-20130617/3203_1 /TAXON_ID=49237 /ORGANISM="Chaetoceros  sp., Strain UNC1202" /LENGTH=277 /DNA_ID=CAMNT_0042694591 /DNA_START=157 /DNA_END=990 /DNA_ORIENTATION=+